MSTFCPSSGSIRACYSPPSRLDYMSPKEAGKLAQQLKAFAVSQRTLLKFLATTQQLKTSCSSSSKESVLFWPPQVTGMNLVQIYTQARNNTQKSIFLKSDIQARRIAQPLRVRLTTKNIKSGLKTDIPSPNKCLHPILVSSSTESSPLISHLSPMRTGRMQAVQGSGPQKPGHSWHIVSN